MPPRNFVVKLAIVSFVAILPLLVISAWKWPLNIEYISCSTMLSHFSSQLWAGEIYPRWLTDTNGGFGSPVFLFYPPLIYYIMSLFEWLSPFDPHGFCRIPIALGLILFISGITCYRWLKCHLPNDQAEKGALLYAGFPYFLMMAYTHYPLAQLLACAVMPFLMETAQKLAQHGQKLLTPFALGYALLTLAHPLSTIAFAPIPCLYVLFFSPRDKLLSRVFTAGTGALLGICLAAISLIPALENKPYAASTAFLWYQGLFQPAWAAYAIVAVLIGFYYEVPKSARSLTPPMRFCVWMLVALLFITSPLSKPLWDHVIVLQYLQGTWRFFPLFVPPAVFLIASWLPHLKSRWICPILSLITLGIFSFINAYGEFYESPRPGAVIMDNHLIPMPEYRTPWMKTEQLDFEFTIPDAYKLMQSVTFVDGQGKASLTSQTSRRITLHAEVTSPDATLTIKRLYFPGWQAETPDMTIHESHALLAVNVPTGSHDITLTVPWYDGEKTGLIISLTALCLLLGITFATRQPKGALNS